MTFIVGTRLYKGSGEIFTADVDKQKETGYDVQICFVQGENSQNVEVIVIMRDEIDLSGEELAAAIEEFSYSMGYEEPIIIHLAYQVGEYFKVENRNNESNQPG